MIYFGKISELVKTLESVKKKEPQLSQYISLILRRIQYFGFEPSLPKTYKKNGFTYPIILPDGVEGNFAFNSDNVSFAIAYSSVTKDNHAMNDATRFLIYPSVVVYFRYDDRTFKDSSKVILLGRVYSNELGSPKAKYISSKIRSAILRIVKLKPDAIEDFLRRLRKGR